MKTLKDIFSHLIVFGKTKNFRNSYWSLLEFTIYPLLMLLATPFFIKKLGVEQMGIWMLINSIIGSLTLLNGGFGDAAIKYISKYNARNDRDGVRRVVNTTFSLFLFVAIIFILVAYPFLLGEEHLKLVSSNMSHREVLFHSLYAVILLLGFRLIEQVVLSIFRGFERYDIASKFSIISKTSMLLLNVVLAALGYSLVQIFISSTVITLIILVIEIYVLKKFFPDLTFNKKLDKETFKEISNFSIWAWLQTLSGIMFSQADKLLIAYCAGLKVLAYYSIGFMVANQIHAVFSAVSSWLFPVISKKVEQKTDIVEPYLKIQFFLISSGIFFITALYAFREFIFTLWLGQETYLASITFIEGFLFFEILLIPFIVPFYYYNAAGLIKENTIFLALSNASMLIFIYVCYRIQGNDGLIWGRLIGFFLVYAIWLFDIHTRLLKSYKLSRGIVLFMPSIIFIVFFSIPVIYIQVPLAMFFFFFLWRLYRAALVEKI